MLLVESEPTLAIPPNEDFPSFEAPLRAAHGSSWLGTGLVASAAAHGAAFGVFYVLTLLGLISLLPARVEGRKTIISMESVASPVPETSPELKTDVFEAPSFEPLEVSHENVPLKVEVTPDHVQIQQQFFVLKKADLVLPTVDHSTLAASAPTPAEQTRSAPVDKREPSATAKHEPAHEPKPRPTPDVLAAFTPPSVPLPNDAGVEETPASLAPNNPPPIYPAEAIARGWTGNCELRVTVSASGAVSKIEVAVSSGHPVLDAAAYHAVRLWRFVPMRRGGTPVESVLRVPVHFLPRG